jgi:hypothetical protein
VEQVISPASQWGMQHNREAKNSTEVESQKLSGHLQRQKAYFAKSLAYNFYATSLSSISIKEEAWTIVHTTSTFYKQYIQRLLGFS